MNKLYNRVKVITPTAGTGTVTLSTAVAGFLTFAEGGALTGDVVTYLLEEGAQFEVGQGTYTSAGLTLSRDTVYRSSGVANIGRITLISAATVSIVAAAEDFGDSSGYVTNAPTTGATITLSAGNSILDIAPAGTIATLSVVLPPSPTNLQVVEINTSNTITSLTVTAPGGATVNGGAGVMLVAHGGMSWRYQLSTTTWRRRYA